jgi:hypothetical protein
VGEAEHKVVEEGHTKAASAPVLHVWVVFAQVSRLAIGSFGCGLKDVAGVLGLDRVPRVDAVLGDSSCTFNCLQIEAQMELFSIKRIKQLMPSLLKALLLNLFLVNHCKSASPLLKLLLGWQFGGRAS